MRRARRQTEAREPAEEEKARVAAAGAWKRRKFERGVFAQQQLAGLVCFVKNGIVRPAVDCAAIAWHRGKNAALQPT
jgi:hypothetical protein